MDSALPIDGLLGTIVETLEPPGAMALLQAPPGAGKTTRVPLALLERFPGTGSILMVEPRRLAARAAAQRLAEGLAEPLGGRVGYSVRLETRRSAATRLEVVTGGILLQRLQSDPSLQGVLCVIFDEFHERRADMDLALALIRESREVLRPDLRLLLMSATLGMESLADRLPEARLLRSEGRSHPVEVIHQSPRPAESLQHQVVRSLETHWLDHREERETVLVFLPGQREISTVEQAISATDWGVELERRALHGQLSLAEQTEAIQPARNRAGKLVLATSIAESSLTIEGVRMVIDSGLSRRSRFDPATGMDGLVTVAASQASAAQRQGRAGRLGPGRCLRLWTAAEQQRRPEFDEPEILQSDPLPIALQLARWGAGLGEDLHWLDPPSPASLDAARTCLLRMGAIEAEGRLTPHGRAIARLGLDPRLGHMLMRADEAGWLEPATAIAVLVSEKDPLERRTVGCDLLARLDWLNSPPPNRAEDRRGRAAGDRWGGHRRRLRELQRQLRLQVDRVRSPREAPAPAAETSTATIVARLLAWAFPERIALARKGRPGRFLMQGGRGAQMPTDDPLAAVPGLAVANVDGQGTDARILLAVPLEEEVLEELTIEGSHTVRSVEWDGAAERVRAERIVRWGALVLERSPWSNPHDDAVIDAMLTGLRQMGPEALPWCSRSRSLLHRLALIHRHRGEPWPDRRPDDLLAPPSDWLLPHLAGMRTRRDLQRLALEEALWGGLPWHRREELNRWLPERLPIPSGRLAAIDYTRGEPVLAVKLQEMFGCTAMPPLLEGSVPIKVELLSPAGRPVALTSDLSSFWGAGYQEVRRELRGRYPRHPWPEDPLRAQATARTRTRLQKT